MDRRHFLLLAAALPIAGPAPATGMASMPIRPGIEMLVTDHIASLEGKRVGLVTNHTGVDRSGTHDIELLRAAGVNLVALFGPEHGLRGRAQAGEKVDSGVDAETGLPVHSLYGATRQPTSEMLEGIDALLFDMQDVGARFYTYNATLLLVLRAAAKAGIEVIILDRPNPLGGELVEGPVMEPPYASFIGVFAMPVIHGMTMGELALMFAGEEKLDVRLSVIRMTGWHRDLAADTFRDLPWIAPSPNMPSPATARLYPGTALFEGTNISEGRGSEKPFEYIGAPFIDSATLIARLEAEKLPGLTFKPISFTPSFSKFAGQLCNGVWAIPTDHGKFLPFRSGVAMVKAVHDLYPGQFGFRSGAPGHFDQLAGVGYVRDEIIAGKSVGEIEARWVAGQEAFRARRRKYLLYA